MAKTKYTVYTDGACSGNPGPGGWANVIINENTGEETSDSGGSIETTNNRMELLGVINALKGLAPSSRVTLYSDSKYVTDAINKDWIGSWKRKGWRRTEGALKNSELWQELYKLLQTLDVSFKWVKGHAGNEYNEMCDRLACEKRDYYAQN
jgi:ribonuclease HI